MMSCYDGLCEFYRINGDELYLKAVKNFWDSVKEDESNILGSVGYCERFSNAKDYPDAATEICDVIHWIRLSYELFSIEGDVKYIEAIEKAFLNAFLAGIYKDGKSGAFFVRSSGRHVTAEMQVETKYQNCCLNNAPRGFINTAEAIVTKSGDDYYINSYIQSTVKFDDISFRIGDRYLTGGAPHVIIRGAKKGTNLYFRIPEWSKQATVITADEKTTVSNTQYFHFVMPSDEAFVRLCFDMSLEITDFTGEYRDLPYTDYHIIRWCDTRNGPCNRNQMVRHPMSIIRRGPLMLARSKRFGNSSEDMFSGETIYGKSATAICEVVKSYNTLCTCNVTIKTEDKEFHYVMCDYASSANEDLSDFNYFTIFV